MEEEEEMNQASGPREPIQMPPDAGADSEMAGENVEAGEQKQEKLEEDDINDERVVALERAEGEGAVDSFSPSSTVVGDVAAVAPASAVEEDSVAGVASTAVENDGANAPLSHVEGDEADIAISSAVEGDESGVALSSRVEGDEGEDVAVGDEDDAAVAVEGDVATAGASEADLAAAKNDAEDDLAPTAEDDVVGATENDVAAAVEEDMAAMVEEDVAAAMEEDVAGMAEDDEAVTGVADEYVGEDEEALGVDVEEREPLVSVEGGSVRVGGRKKRGRPSKGQVVRPHTKKKEEEDLCFICFDGGNLVVCDRRGCPKVYHPACVNRDEAFFRSKGRWNCGWHICSICEKAAHYMCLTCTYSLCKGCIKEAEFFCVRGNKGFCATCRSTVMLIETNEHANSKTVGVDFDDRNSWEYLFKDYWLDMKVKLSITLEELTGAKNPWKGSLTHNEESSDELYDAKNDLGSGSDSSSGRHEGSKSVRKRLKRRLRTTTNEEESRKIANVEGASMPEDCEWASKELLEFVAHMRDGDRSVMSPFDVQPLLLEYIKQNNLRDPRRKSQIICDSRLEHLFGKPRVGHFEMLKLLELHFPAKEASQVVTDDNQGGVIDPESSQMDTDGKYDATAKMSSDKKRRSRRRMEEREPQTNLDDYAAIDVHNINLIYLRRHLMEDLIDDTETFDEKVIGSFVKIRISGSTGQRQDMYRLVQVVGTGKAAEKYKTGKKTTDITLEILNLDKTEVILIDSISNQEFTEEECKRLRQSIKCGLLNRLTVGEVQEKAMALQAVRVNDWLESEKSRLGNLRDRASEKGRRKELRECVEKLQLLNSPEERSRRLNEVPEVHADPHMDPSYESEEEESEDKKKQENYGTTRDSVFVRKGRELNSSGMGSNKNTVTKGAWEKIDASTSAGDRTSDSTFIQGRDVHHMNNWDAPKPLATATVMDTGGRNNSQLALRPGQLSDIAPEASSLTQSSGAAASSNISETDKLWHYQDPSGKIQGPFSMTQLRKWNTTGYFPPNLKIWRTHEKQEHSILLTDALIGKFQQPTVAAVIDGRENSQEGSWGGNTSSTWVDKKRDGGEWKLSRSVSNLSSSSNVELTKADGWAARPSGRSGPSAETMVLRGGQLGSSSHVWGSAKDVNAFSSQPQVHNVPPSAAPFSINAYQSPAHQGRVAQGGNSGGWNGGPTHGVTWNATSHVALQPSDRGYERQHSATWTGQRSSGESWRVQPPNDPSNRWRTDSFDLPTPTQPNNSVWIHGAGNNPSASSSVSTQPTGCSWGTTPSPSQRGNTGHQTPTAVNEPSRIASVWTEQPRVSMSSTEGGWKPNSSHLAVNPTEMVSGGDPRLAAAVSVAKATNAAVGFGSSLSSSVQNVPSESDQPITLANQSTLALTDEFGASNSGRVSGGFGSIEVQNDYNKKQSHENDCPSPTPKDNQIKFGALISECSQQVPSQFVDSVEHPLIFQNVDLEKKCYGTHNRSANESTSVNCLGPNAASVAPPTTQKSDVLACDGLETLISDMKNKPDATVSLEVNQSLDSASSTKMLETRLLHDGLASVSAQRQVVDSSLVPAFESQEELSASSQKHGTISLDPNSAVAVGRLEQSQFQKPGPIQLPIPATSGNWVASADMKSTEWSMPSPTPSTKPSGFNEVVVSASTTSQSDQQILLVNSKQPPSSAHWSTNTYSELTLPSDVGQSAGDKEIKNTGQAVAQENSYAGVVPPKGNANMVWGTSVQGNSNTGWGTMMQGTVNLAWGPPGQGNTNVMQGNANAGMGWIAPAQGNTGVNVGWGAPVQGNANPNVGWGTSAPGNTQPNPSWGMVAGQGISNSQVGWVASTQENTSQDPRWAPPAQGNTNPAWVTPQGIDNAGWAGQGNSNLNRDAPAGNPGSWGPQQKQHADRYSNNGERGFPGSESGHGGGRHGWNRMQHGGGGPSRAAPARGGQRAGICKYHESGHCRKGANCTYYHT